MNRNFPIRRGRPLSAYVCTAVFVFLACNGVIPSAKLTGGVDSVQGILFQVFFLLVMLALVATRFKAVLRLTGQLWLTLSLPLLAILSSLWSQSFSISFRRGICAGIVMLFANYLVVRFRPAALFDIVMFAGLIAGTLSIATALLLPAVGRDVFNAGAWQGIFGAKNNCAFDMLFFISPLLAARSWRGLALWKYALLLVAAILLVMAHSKMAFIVLAVVIPTILAVRVLRRFDSRTAVVFRVLAIATAALCVVFITTVLPVLLQSLGKGSTFGGRTPIWHAVLQTVRLRPLLGYGYEAFWDVVDGQVGITTRYIGFQISNAQSGFLDVLLQLGIVGLVLLMFFFAKAFRDFSRVSWRPNRYWRDWTFVVLMLLLVYELDESLLLRPYQLPWFLTLIAVAMLHCAARSRVRRPMPSQAVRLVPASQYESWTGQRVMQILRSVKPLA